MSVLPNEYGDFLDANVTWVDSSLIQTTTKINIAFTSLNPIPPNAKLILQIPKEIFTLDVATTNLVTF